MRRILPLLCCVFMYTYAFAQKDCRHQEYTDKLLTDYPEMKQKMVAVEEFITSNSGDRRTVLSGTANASSIPDIITIPVVVHILYNTEAQNLSDQQILSQIEALNKDYRHLNQDKINVPAHFAGLAADCGIEFQLAKTDPKGFATNGIVRRKTSIQLFGTDDRAKFTSRGGDDAWDAGKYLNIWVCNLVGGVVGYSSPVGGPAATDGVVIASTAFGIGPGNTSTFNKGRTATHEIGHWLNLRHIWGDTYCGDDKVDDTPSQRSPNRGCPSGKNFTCGTTTNGDMYMNFMDLTNDACMYMFTAGQRERMRALFMPGGPRNSLLKSHALTASSSEPSVPATLPLNDKVPVNASGAGIYPNPASTSFTVQLSDADLAGGRTFAIYNHLGQPVQHCQIKGKLNKVDISHLNNGVYYLKSIDGDSKTMMKFVKVK